MAEYPTVRTMTGSRPCWPTQSRKLVEVWPQVESLWLVCNC
jgi:hypothetical protein